MNRLGLAAVVVTLVASTACKPESARRADHAAKQTLAQRAELQAAAARIGEGSDIVESTSKVLHEAGELAQAAQEFETRRTARISALRAQLDVIASQPKMIGTMAKSLPLSDAGRSEVNAKLTQLHGQLDETSNMIDGLQQVEVDAWEQRDSEMTAAMQRLDDARKAAWRALQRAPRTTRSSS